MDQMVEFWKGGQTWLQLPQLYMLEKIPARSISHPLLGSPSQSAQSFAQVSVYPHTPSVQVASPLPWFVSGTGQTLPQLPQFFTSLLTSDSQPLQGSLSQSSKSFAQVDASPHTPSVQVGAPVPNWPVGQTLPQLPQLLTLLFTSNSHPLLGSPSQSAKPVAQVSVCPHTPLVQVAKPVPNWLESGTGQTFPQLPQFLTSVFRLFTSTSHPLAFFWSQSSHPRLHFVPHFPFLHVRSLWGGARGHLCLHFPQLSTSLYLGLASAQQFLQWTGQQLKSKSIKLTPLSSLCSQQSVTHQCEGCRGAVLRRWWSLRWQQHQWKPWCSSDCSWVVAITQTTPWTAGRDSTS